MYPLLHRLEDIKWMLTVRGYHRTDIKYRYDHLHARLATCIVLLGSKSRFRRLRELVHFFANPNEDMRKHKNGVYDRNGTVREDSEKTNVIYLMFSPYSKACYIGETKTKARIATHAKESYKPTKNAQKCHFKMNKIGFQKFVCIPVGLRSTVDRKGMEARLIKKYSGVLPLMNVEHNKSHLPTFRDNNKDTPRAQKAERQKQARDHVVKTTPSNNEMKKVTKIVATIGVPLLTSPQ